MVCLEEQVGKTDILEYRNTRASCSCKYRLRYIVQHRFEQVIELWRDTREIDWKLSTIGVAITGTALVHDDVQS